MAAMVRQYRTLPTLVAPDVCTVPLEQGVAQVPLTMLRIMPMVMRVWTRRMILMFTMGSG